MISDEWTGRTGRAWADEWRRTDRSFAQLTERLLARTRELDFAAALDIGCGAGELSLAPARGRPRLAVVGLDVSPDLVAAARERSGYLANVAFACGDAAEWRPAGGFVPDLLISRHGVMFFPDPVSAFANFRAIAAEGAHLLFSCFRERGANPLFAEVAALLLPPAEPVSPDDPGPFAFADPTKVEGLLATTGWSQVGLEPFDFGMIVGAGADPVADAESYFKRIGPAARALAELDPAGQERLLAGLREVARRHLHDGLVVFRAAAWIVGARRG